MTRLAMCSKADPTTCFEASKAHILTGRCGRSLHLLKTSESRARRPKAPWIKRAKGPNNLHSPSSAPGRGAPSPVEFEAAVAMAATIEAVEDGMRRGAEDETTIKPSSAGLDVEAAARSDKGTSSGKDM